MNAKDKGILALRRYVETAGNLRKLQAEVTVLERALQEEEQMCCRTLHAVFGDRMEEAGVIFAGFRYRVRHDAGRPTDRQWALHIESFDAEIL